MTAACYPLTSTQKGEPLPEVSLHIPTRRRAPVDMPRLSDKSPLLSTIISTQREEEEEEGNIFRTDGNGDQYFTSILTTRRPSSDGANDKFCHIREPGTMQVTLNLALSSRT